MKNLIPLICMLVLGSDIQSIYLQVTCRQSSHCKNDDVVEIENENIIKAPG